MLRSRRRLQRALRARLRHGCLGRLWQNRCGLLWRRVELILLVRKVRCGDGLRDCARPMVCAATYGTTRHAIPVQSLWVAAKFNMSASLYYSCNKRIVI